MKITKAEFDKCWSEVLGDDSDWVVAEGNCPEFYDPDEEVFEIDGTWVFWDSWKSSPDTNNILLKEDLAYDCISFETLYKRWKGIATVQEDFINPPDLSLLFHGLGNFKSKISVKIEVPPELAEEVQARLNRYHPKVL